MGKIPRIFFVLLAVLTGSLFLFSAYTKLYPTIQAFEYNIAAQSHLPYMTASILARFFIGLEGGLGSLIIFHYFGKNNWVLKGAFALIAGFTLYLVWLWIKAGNSVNCGCFGNNIWMRPSTSIIKNVVLLAVLGLLIHYHRGLSVPFRNLIPVLHMACAFSLAYLMNPIFTHYKLDFAGIYADKKYAPTIDLARGKHIITFAHPGCEHCRNASRKMHEIRQSNPAIPFFLVIGDTTADISDFWNETHAQDIPSSRLDEEHFDKYTGGEYPQIMWVNNGMVEANTVPSELDQKVIEQWLR